MDLRKLDRMQSAHCRPTADTQWQHVVALRCALLRARQVQDNHALASTLPRPADCRCSGQLETPRAQQVLDLEFDH